MKPVIGITGPDRGGWPAWMATRIAVWRAGGRAVRVTPSRPRSLDSLSGLIIGGGADVDPKLYKEDCMDLSSRKTLRREMRRRWRRREAQALVGYCSKSGFKPSLRGQFSACYRLVRYRVGLVVDFILLVSLWIIRQAMSVSFVTAEADHVQRDALEVPLIRDALSRGLPVLGICRGMQLINVCLGGSLHQEISVFYEETPILTTLLPRKRVSIAPSSRLHKILGGDFVRVNSLHFQSVKTLGTGLVVVANEPNGVVQAFEHPGDAFVVGVQWHPEYLAVEKPSQQRLFFALVSAARLAMHAPARASSVAVSVVPATDHESLSRLANPAH